MAILTQNIAHSTFSPHKPIEWFYIQSRKLKDSSDSSYYFSLVSGSSKISCSKKMECFLHAKSVLNPPCPVKVQSKSKENQKINQKKKSKNGSVKRLRCISDTPWAFFDLSSVAEGLQSAMQQYYLPTIYILLEYEYI